MFKRSEYTSDLFFQAYVRKLEEAKPKGYFTDDELKSLVFLAVKFTILDTSKNETLESLQRDFRSVCHLKGLMALLTPRQLMNVFPITKTYDGEKWEVKDYFSTMEMVRAHGLDVPIGEAIDDFLWDYQNHDIRFLGVHMMGTLNDLLRAEGKPTILDHLCAETGIPFYTMDKDGETITGPIKVKKARGVFCYDEREARTKQLKKQRPNYLKVVKKNKPWVTPGEKGSVSYGYHSTSQR